MMHGDGHPERMMFGQNRAWLRRDPLGQKDWNTRADAEKLDVLDRAQSRQQLVDLVVAENERVAAAQEHITHFGVLFEITKRFLKIGVQFLFANAADHATARAISAVSRTTTGYQK